ncbi:NAD-dependent protein deacylase sirtuin-5, mitochondrial isoform X2 [Orussus abietinus]|uniref:NAD-dependent protein deacylase sirtuin-5, mitochondrial isoform X2 n=1 Tax=Orussus abietinus TaxID=222816 RepID=UPI000626882B|nr:NAD-dependent protein deacylase sirtuin-5, mitochondrial isoform X2 [Orussus abietinus]
MMNVMRSFRETLFSARNVLILTGSGVSAESGVPTFRGAEGLWRTYRAESLATPEAFAANPSLVWQFYEYRRDLVSKVKPNKAHEALAAFEDRFLREGKKITVLTQNVDGLHQKAGSKNVLELHGNLYKTRCTKCKEVLVNETVPICPALALSGDCNFKEKPPSIPKEDLPKCEHEGCRGLLRPHIVWFGENLDQSILDQAQAIDSCDACLIVGTSSIVYPAAMFAPQVATRGIPVAEFNLETTPATRQFQYHFQGPCTITVPEALAP